jgi:hypothetical protein
MLAINNTVFKQAENDMQFYNPDIGEYEEITCHDDMFDSEIKDWLSDNNLINYDEEARHFILNTKDYEECYQHFADLQQAEEAAGE